MNTSELVTIEDMMNCRERRAAIQQEYLDAFHATVISFCMNIPGPIKTNDDIRAAFDSGCNSILHALTTHNISILAKKELHEKTGDELILCVNQAAPEIKDLMCAIEESHPLGRLFDIDVLDQNGQKLSRTAYRKCILCNCQAQECARSRRHSVDEMFEKITDMIETWHATQA